MTEFESKQAHYYSQEDVQQILHLAISRQVDDDDKEFSYQQLLEIAVEMDISPESLKLAERDWKNLRGELQHRQTFNTLRRTRFKKRLGNYAIVNTILVAVDLMGGGGLGWSLYVVLFWGMGLALDAWNSLQTKGEDYEAAFQKWYRKYQLKSSFDNILNKLFKATSG
ncbi:2TM domain-containing protein [Mastigocoleus testarum]|uniref:2TM domain-containing protein n=1 Tax=Mastigocoleus testarum BC008 TaxID=371196 RepID=A0A0V7ZWL7_9CYAN|nr:2TM domain-containing protein [Mastigocoleus testarum]KST69013.1 hypothetical protein BC008_02805 [Mastigocoleus testarum BC008]